MASGDLLNVVIHVRATLLQLYLIISMCYHIQSEKYTHPTLSASCHNKELPSVDSGIVYSSMTSLFESSRLAHRTHTISWKHAQLVRDDALLP